MIYWTVVKNFIKSNPRLVKGALIALVILACGVFFKAWVGHIRQEAFNSGVASEIAKTNAAINEAMISAMENQEKVRKQYEKIYLDINAADDNSGACMLVDRVIDGLPNCKSDNCK